MIMSDDQDRRLGSTDFQGVLHREIFAQGVEFVNHFATIAQCCPSRASLLRGQAAHNTNVTNVHAPGGNYDKWVVAGLDEDYLPHWLKKAGYRAEYVGKFLNGLNVVNANIMPKGWDHIDALLDPYTTYYNVPVMSQNGERPVYYKGFHSTDVVRIKALDRLKFLLSQKQPYYLQIAPYSVHVQNDINRAVPLARHMDLFPDVGAPRLPNYNPPDEYQAGKGSWLRTLPLMNASVQAEADYSYRLRAQSLQGVDEIIQDVVHMLSAHGQLDDTYIVFTSDNGYKIGQHRVPGGKALFYAEDTNLPFAVRGPGIPKNVTSQIPGVHLDLAPTFLDIAGLPRSEWPAFLDGQSLLPQWRDPHASNGSGTGDGNSKETLNVEFWGSCTIEAPNGRELGAPFKTTSYKTLRMLGDRQSWLLSVWCTGDVELYDTAADPFELRNLAGNPDYDAVWNRLNALLLVTKSCAGGTCRDPWAVFAANSTRNISTMAEAMDPRYDAYFASFPRVHFGTCMQYQDIKNEEPFYPPAAATTGLGQADRRPTDNFVSTNPGVAITDAGLYGTLAQRNATLEQVYANARNLTDAEINMPGGRVGGAEKRWGVMSVPEWILEGHD
ncbi:arylsulfatase [Periconia macrospinosa]|uniref:Arylsulfatase n=1 Tax=Periconia macrospinosa TaxID=97972 RepID=A0A2V1DWM8_9PLEO|nr:arylsulfatase [Periconia macrospinosa]